MRSTVRKEEKELRRREARGAEGEGREAGVRSQKP